jgi:HrpA-like RNA helicase
MSSREESKRAHDKRQQLTLLKREDDLLKHEENNPILSNLTKQELENLQLRRAMVSQQHSMLQSVEKYERQHAQLLDDGDGGGDGGGGGGGPTTPRSTNPLRHEHHNTYLDKPKNNTNIINSVKFLQDTISRINGENDPQNDPNYKPTRIIDQENEPDLSKLTEFERIQYHRRKLPSYQQREALLQSIKTNQVLIIEGKTGSGKTTQIMQYLYEAGYCNDGKIVACTQPRRVAATSVAARVAVEMGFQLGKEVGYNVRFDNCTSEETRVKYLTDGMLLRELLTDSELSRYSIIMIDEAHERTISTDILLGILKSLLLRRTDLKLLIASATINTEKFSTFFNHAPTFKIPGRTCNIDIYYTQKAESDYVEAAIMTILQIHTTQPLNGDVLVFLPGQEEIQLTHDFLLEKYTQLTKADPHLPNIIICPIYANLPAETQAKIFSPTPPNTRKVVLATNIAETSLTIDGIVYVIDSGWCKTKIAASSSSSSS